MKYFVRNEHGSLEVPDEAALREGLGSGLISPDDEYRRDDQTEWRTISSVPGLVPATPKRRPTFTPEGRWVLAAVAGLFSAVALARVNMFYGLMLGAAIAVGVIAVTNNAQNRKK